jgi:hypothetical protein
MPELLRLARARAGRAGLVLLVGLLGGVVVAGCASMPTSGSVHDGRPGTFDAQDSRVRVLPPPPRAGATVQDIVRGFLLASPTFEDGHRIAQQYLSADAQKSWHPDAGTTVYDGTQVSYDNSDLDDHVVVTVSEVARIGADGRYEPLPAPVRKPLDFGLVKSQGQWRISDVPDGLLLSSLDVGRVYRQASLYFLDPTGQVVVPDPILLPVLPGLATTLTTRLLAGPTSWLAPGVTTAFPDGTALAVRAVKVESGVAEVRLNDAANAATPAERQAMSAQLAWTLRQLSEVQRIRITVNDTDFAVPGAPVEQGVDFWNDYDPGVLSASAAGYIVRGGRLGTFDGEFRAVSGPVGDGRARLLRPAVSPDETRVAGLTDGGRTLVSGRLNGSVAPRPVLNEGQFAPPSWDRLNGLWTVDRSTGQVYTSGLDGMVTVPVAGMPQGAVITQARVSRDGVRVALVASHERPGGRVDEVYVAVVQRGDVVQGGERRRLPLRLAGAHRIGAGLSTVRDVAWLDAQHLVVLGVEPGGVAQIYVLDVDGYSVDPGGLPDATRSVTVAAAPGPRPILVGLSGSDGQPAQVYQSSGRNWMPLADGGDPLYPG